MSPVVTLGRELMAVLENSVEPTLVASPRGPVLGANAAACALFGYEEMVGLSREEVCLSSVEGGTRAELTLLKKGGQRFDADVSTTEFRGADGAQYLWICVRDLTEEQRVAATLRDTEEQLRALSEATFESICVHLDGTILFTNSAAERTYRVPPGGLRGRSLMEFVAPESRELVKRLGAEGREQPYEGQGLRSDGTTFPAEVQARNIDFGGKRVRVIAVRDITERKRIEEELAHADRMASLGTLAAGIAHEINNPLTFVTVNLAAARSALEADAPLDLGALRALLEDASIGADRVRRIVQDLGSFSRPGQEIGPVALAPVVAYATNVTRGELRHRARLEIDLDDVPPVAASETRVGQILINLLVNAAQSIPEGAADRNRIHVRARRRGDRHVSIEVTDTGKGMPPELVARVFEPFVTTKDRTGTGLGLSICQRIVTALGGTIEVESEVGRGSTFRVVLPAASFGDAAEAVQAPSTKVSGARRRILIVDDEPILRRTLSRLLEGEYESVGCGSAQEALDVLAGDAHFDAIISDLMMPEMTGMDFYDALLARYPSLAARTVFLTGGVFTERARRFLEEGGIRYVEKPFELDALRAAIRSATSARDAGATSR